MPPVAHLPVPTKRSARRRIVGLAACGTALVLGGCSSDDAGNTGTTTSTTTTTIAAGGGATTTTAAADGSTASTPAQSGPIDPGMVLSSDEVVTSLDVEPATTTKP